MKGSVSIKEWAYPQKRRVGHRKYINTGYAVYQCTKLWYPDRADTQRMFEIISRLGRYDKVKMHLNTIYMTRRVSAMPTAQI